MQRQLWALVEDRYDTGSLKRAVTNLESVTSGKASGAVKEQ